MNYDPTREEMLELLKYHFFDEDPEDLEWSLEEAIYWFSADYHDGQTSNLYSALSISPYHPGPILNGILPASLSEKMYNHLVITYS